MYRPPFAGAESEQLFPDSPCLLELCCLCHAKAFLGDGGEQKSLMKG